MLASCAAINKLDERPVAHPKRENHPDGQPCDSNGHQSHIHAVMHQFCRDPLPSWGADSGNAEALPAHDPKPQRQDQKISTGENKFKPQECGIIQLA